MNLDPVSSRLDAGLLDADIGDPRSTGAERAPAAPDAAARQDDGLRAPARDPHSGAGGDRTGGGWTDLGGDRNAVLARLQPAPAPAAAPAPSPTAPDAAGDAGRRMPAAQLNDQSVWLLARGADRAGLLPPRQAALNAGVAQALLQQPAAGTAAPLRFGAHDVAALALASGAAAHSVRALGADAAAAYLNAATDPVHQQERLRGVLDLAHSAAHVAPPRPSAQEMKQELRALLGMPEKAFKKMGDAEIAAKYDQVMAALQTGGDFRIKFGKYNVSFSVDANGQITACRCKKRGLFGGLFSAIGNFFGKFGKAILSVCSFVPIPWISIPARIVSGVVAVVEGVKGGNVLQAVAGIADAAVGGVAAIAGKAAGGVAGAVAAVAGRVRDAAHGAQAAIASFQRGGFNGLVNGVLQAASVVSDAFGDAFGGIAAGAKSVQQWADRVLVGERVVVDIKNGRIVDALQGGTGLAGDVAEALGASPAATGTIARIHEAAGHGDRAVDTVGALLRGDVQAALTHGADLAQRLDAGLGTRIAPRFDPEGGWIGAAGKWIDHGADALALVRDVAGGRVDAALQSAASLADGMTWDHALERIAAPAGVDRAQWDAARHRVGETLRAWSGFVAGGRGVLADLRAGDYDAAFDRALGLGNAVATGLGGAAPIDPRSGWAAQAGRLLGQAEIVREAVGHAAAGRLGEALDAAARAARATGIDFGLDAGPAATVRAHLGAWTGFAGDGARVAVALRAGDARAAAAAVDLAVGLGGYLDAPGAYVHGAPPAWTTRARRHGGDIVAAGLQAREAIRGGDVAASVAAARSLYAAVKAAVEGRHAGGTGPAPLPRAA